MWCNKRSWFIILYLMYYIVSFVFRGIVFAAGKLFKSGFVMLLPRSSVPLASAVYKEANLAVLILATLESELPIEKVKGLLKRVVEKEEYNTLSCQLSTFGGFYSWFKEVEFSIDKHVFEIEGKRTLDIEDFRQNILSESFEEGKSPWVLYVLKNVLKDGIPGHFCALKSHHVLADGYSLLGLATKELYVCQEEINVAPIAFPLSVIPRVILEMKWLFQAAASIADLRCAIMLEGPSNIFTALKAPKRDKQERHYVSSKTIPVSVIKRIKDEMGTSFISIILAGFSRATRNCLIVKNVELDKKRPECAFITGLPNHPGGLTNHYGRFFLELPLDLGQGKESAIVINEQISTAREKRQEFRSAKFVQILGGLPASKFPSSFGEGVAIFGSDFPGPTKPLKFLEVDVNDIEFCVGPMGEEGLSFFSLSYNGIWKLNLSVHNRVLGTREEAKAFADSVVDYMFEMVK